MARTPQQGRMIKLRKVFGMTQAQFAEFIGCVQSNIGHYENTSQVPSVEMAKRIIMSFNKRGVLIGYEFIYGLPWEE